MSDANEQPCASARRYFELWQSTRGIALMLLEMIIAHGGWRSQAEQERVQGAKDVLAKQSSKFVDEEHV